MQTAPKRNFSARLPSKMQLESVQVSMQSKPGLPSAQKWSFSGRLPSKLTRQPQACHQSSNAFEHLPQISFAEVYEVLYHPREMILEAWHFPNTEMCTPSNPDEFLRLPGMLKCDEILSPAMRNQFVTIWVSQQLPSELPKTVQCNG